jgi:hypothetical protein
LRNHSFTTASRYKQNGRTCDSIEGAFQPTTHCEFPLLQDHQVFVNAMTEDVRLENVQADARRTSVHKTLKFRKKSASDTGWHQKGPEFA